MQPLPKQSTIDQSSICFNWALILIVLLTTVDSGIDVQEELLLRIYFT